MSPKSTQENLRLRIHITGAAARKLIELAEKNYLTPGTQAESMVLRLLSEILNDAKGPSSGAAERLTNNTPANKP